MQQRIGGHVFSGWPAALLPHSMSGYDMRPNAAALRREPDVEGPAELVGKPRFVRSGPKGAIEQVMDHCDKDGDGISYKEFIDVLARDNARAHVLG